MVVVVIIGILVTVAIPVFFASVANSRMKTCFANQRTIEGAIPTWESQDPSTNTEASIAGVVNATNPLMADHVLLHVPRCPSAPDPANPINPTAAEGAYSLDTSGNVLPCPFGTLGAHGSYR